LPQANPTPQASAAPSVNEAEAALRPLNPIALRRSWAEPAVRSWWLTAAVLAVMSVWLVTEQFIVNHEISYRISHWTHISGRIDKIGDSSRISLRVQPEVLSTADSQITYKDTAGVSHTASGRLGGQLVPRHPSDIIPLLIDPVDPSQWTDRTELPSLAERLMIPVLLVPVAVCLGLVGLWQRSRLLKLWQTGVQREAKVVHVQQSATSPWSSLLRCAVAESHDNRLLRVTVPHRRAKLQPGDSIQLITSATGKPHAIAAMLYQ
jgi:hypothetical protein